jgi:hypothetical protein
MSMQKTMIQFFINFIIIIVFSTFIFLNTDSSDWTTKKDLSFTDCLYLCLTSLSSVGYGDITPLSNKAKYILLSLQFIVILEILTFFEYIKYDEFNYNFIFKVVMSFVLLLMSSLYFTFMTENSDWNMSNNNTVNFLNMTYFSSTTLTTCGYGDITPLTLKSKIPVMIMHIIIIYQILSLLS